jgi:hypothetical protein
MWHSLLTVVGLLNLAAACCFIKALPSCRRDRSKFRWTAINAGLMLLTCALNLGMASGLIPKNILGI